MRDVPAAMATNLNDETIRDGLMVKLMMEPTPLYMHTGVGDLLHDGNIYIGAGKLGSVSPVKENGRIAPHQITVAMTGLDQSVVDEMRANNYRNKGAEVSYFTLNEDMQLDGVSLLFKGRMDVASIKVGVESTVSIPIYSRFVDWQKVASKRYSNEQQLTKGRVVMADPTFNDNSFKFMSQIDKKPILWGVSVSGTGFNAVNGEGGGSKKMK